jgi:hypothetical protein
LIAIGVEAAYTDDLVQMGIDTLAGKISGGLSKLGPNLGELSSKASIK